MVSPHILGRFSKKLSQGEGTNEQMRLPQEGGQSANFSTNFSYGQTNYKNTMGEFIYVQGNLSTTSGRHQMDRSEGDEGTAWGG